LLSVKAHDQHCTDFISENTFTSNLTIGTQYN
jgi:hypothetical protein